MGKNVRNKPCWCGSGIKFKKCHLTRQAQSPLTREDLEDHSKKKNSKKVCCVRDLFPNECSKNIINAHTISKSGSLSEISENSHVMGTKPSLAGLIRNQGQLTLEKVGINKASTFTGFCSIHDKNIFSPIEDELITLNDKQLFLLAYRGMCRELFHKELSTETANLMREADRGQNKKFQNFVQNQANLFEKGVDLALRDLRYMKAKMDSILINENYKNLSHCIFELSETPKILVSAMIAPEMDFNGNEIQQIGIQEEVYSYIFFNCISYDGRGCFVFSWLVEHDLNCGKFIKSLLELNNDQISDALVRFCYSFSENTWASPSWWDSLTIPAQKSICSRLLQGTTLAMHPIDCLKDDNHRFNAIKIYKRELRSPALT